ncbi:dephospho-CoA kinase, partial [Wolbachia endosymbiont of Nomada ferruginata]|uniref:dephospho-CoA kinase n=1 Tax=Wolbachia endosymbiont of Nomada ferruginata TaxID=1854761 RepID=UPI001FE219B5
MIAVYFFLYHQSLCIAKFGFLVDTAATVNIVSKEVNAFCYMIIGLTGGIGVGKSFVANCFQEFG